MVPVTELAQFGSYFFSFFVAPLKVESLTFLVMHFVLFKSRLEKVLEGDENISRLFIDLRHFS